MPIWFYDKETKTPNIFGSLRAISNNSELSEKILYSHFSIPSNNDELKYLENIQKKLIKNKVINFTIFNNIVYYSDKYDECLIDIINELCVYYHEDYLKSLKNFNQTYGKYKYLNKSSNKKEQLYVIKYFDIEESQLLKISIKLNDIIKEKIKTFKKQYHNSYIDDRYELYKLDIIRN